MLYDVWPYNFGALKNQNFKKAKIIIVPVPYDPSTTYKSGTREGPQAIVDASRHIDEVFETKKGTVFKDSGAIFTFDEVELCQESPEKMMEGLEQLMDKLVGQKKIPLMLGGEHSLTLGPVRALKKKYKNLSILQIDAHTDLRDEYEGNKYSHACVMRRIRDLGILAVQVGIRSFDKEIDDYIKEEKIKTIFPAPALPIQKIINCLSSNVYLTVDLDGFDPSIMPAVGTPEPGGLGWYEVLRLIESVSKKKNIVGADIVELCPIPGFIAPDYLAAKLTYKIINFILNK